MGTQVEVRLPDEHVRLLPGVEQRVRALERQWSRFLDNSEICQLNDANGNPVIVSPETVRLLTTAITAHELTGGLFDPRVLPALEAAGYDRSHEHLVPNTEPFRHVVSRQACGDRPAPLSADIDPESALVQLPPHDRWDLGGLGKGLACDILTEELWDLGVRGSLVNLGGDMRMHGDPVDQPCWTVSIEDPEQPGSVVGDIHLSAGAVATSSRARRRWTHEGQPRHHLIDPRTRQPADTALVAVTVVAESTWWAEVLAKAALIAGRAEGLQLLQESGCSAVLIDAEGEITSLGEHTRLREPS